MPFTANPPRSTTTSTGMPRQAIEVTGAVDRASFSSGAPPCRPKLMPALIMPEKTATRMPFLKLYSATAFFFTSSGSSFSLDMPAMPTSTMPARETSTPTSEALVEGVP